ncbi:MAG TPA: hypothetical protein VMG60_24185 [Burkholderiaceae bacterium]|nr:hypothetical protein [Burkholderiaceae bacterium]
MIGVALRRPVERVAPAETASARSTEARTEAAYPPAFLGSESLSAAAPSATVPVSPRAIDLCGYGKVDPEEIPAALEAAADAALLRAIDDFDQARDPRKRALALATKAWVDAQAADRRVVARDPATCRETPLCDQQAAEAFALAATPSIEALARLASTAQDPQVYVWAMRACRSILPDSPPSACDALTLDRWAQVDPDNAMVWLLNARAAKMRNDTPGFEDALLRASRATSFDRRRTPYGEILANVDESAQPARTLIVGRLADADARDDPGEYFSNFSAVGLYCEQQSAPGRRELCSDLAHVLLDLSSDQLARLVGIRVATGGLPPFERTEARKREISAGAGHVANPENPLGCREAAQTEARLIGMATPR